MYQKISQIKKGVYGLKSDRHKKLFLQLLTNTEELTKALEKCHPKELNKHLNIHNSIMDEIKSSGLNKDKSVFDLLKEVELSVNNVIILIKTKQEKIGQKLLNLVKRKKQIEAYNANL